MNSDGENIIKKTKIPSSLIIGYIVCVVLIIVSFGFYNEWGYRHGSWKICIFRC